MSYVTIIIEGPLFSEPDSSRDEHHTIGRIGFCMKKGPKTDYSCMINNYVGYATDSSIKKVKLTYE